MSAQQRIQQAIGAASAGLIGRRPAVELLALAAVARQHVLVLGPPGTAKSELVRRFARAVDATRFEYLLGRFTEPAELFGPIDLVALREGRVLTRTDGMLPEAELAFLDEVFLGSTAILNTLLGLLNERRFRRGHDTIDVPLRLCVGASNELPETPELGAFADRFAVVVHVEPVEDALLEDLLSAAAVLPEVAACATVDDLDALAAQARAVKLDAVRPLYAEAVRSLRQAGLSLSDRRIVQGQRLIAAAASLAGRTEATAADLWPLVFTVPTAADQQAAREALRSQLDAAHHPSLNAAAELASASPAARAQRLQAQAEDALRAFVDGSGKAQALEAVAREIDTTFAADARPEGIVAVRQRLALALNA